MRYDGGIVMKFMIAPWLAVLVFGMVSGASAQVRHVDIPNSNLTAHAARTEGEGPYYVLALTLPAEIRVARQAWLELRADLSVPEMNGFRDPTSIFQVFMLKNELSGDPTEEDFETLRVPMSRPVAVGTERSIKIDVTEYVQRILGDPSVNHGLILGSVTGERRGNFQIKSDAFGAGIVARLNVVE
jgi:hypothetical protein